jgi:DNA-binding transcriptional MerR regulator
MATWTKWTTTEEATLLAEIKTTKTIAEIAKLHNRTVGAISSRLHYIISRSILSDKGCPLADIKSFLKRNSHCETRLPITMEFKQTFTREKLQGLAEEHRLQQLTHFIDSQIANHVIGCASQGKTSFLYEQREDMIRNPHQYVPTDEELVAGLRVKFPGAAIARTEEWVDEIVRTGRPPTRVLKKGVKIDWS